MEESQHAKTFLPFFVAETAYQSLQQNDVDSDPSPVEDMDLSTQPVWAIDSFTSQYCLDIVMLSYEAILEALIRTKRPWEDVHHHSFFLLALDKF